MDVLITGAQGNIGPAIPTHLGDDPQYDFSLLDIAESDNGITADVTNYDDIRPFFTGQDAVVHLAIHRGMSRPGSLDILWSEPFENTLKGINNVYAAAVDAGLDTIVFASSNHAVGLAEIRNRPDIYFDPGDRVGHDEPHRPDSLYGLTKTYGEDLGRLVAELGGIQFYGLRLGIVRPPAYDHPFGHAEAGVEREEWTRGSEEYRVEVARMRASWLSRRDFAHLVDCCLRDADVEWDHFYGVSANERRWLDDLDYAKETIGYTPRDNGEEWDEPP